MEREAIIQKAADLILSADYIIVATGAGMSADSGLPVYKDTQKIEAYIRRKLTYMDLCTPDWNFDDPATFYGFWGSSLQQFRDAIPHEGYTIIKKWRDELFSKPSDDFQNALSRYSNLENVTDPPGPFFVYTSNVDALHLKAGFRANEIIEIHGNIETWQCSRACTAKTWSVPLDFTFDVNPITMLAKKLVGEEEVVVDFTQNNGFVSNHPRCMVCGDYSRPAILMFGDFGWVRGKTLWTSWRSTVSHILQDNRDLSTVILEIGCGKNVPSVRCMGEDFLNSYPDQCNLIRINRDFILPDRTLHPEKVLGIQGSGLPILKEIDDVIQRKLLERKEHEAQANLQKQEIAELQKREAAELQKLPVELPSDDVDDDELAYEMKLRATLEDVPPVTAV